MKPVARRTDLRPGAFAANLPYNMGRRSGKMADGNRLAAILAKPDADVQREVAEHIIAVPRTKAYRPPVGAGPMARTIQNFFDMSRSAFVPPPM